MSTTRRNASGGGEADGRLILATNHGTLWAELAFWFPALSRAAGTALLPMPTVDPERFVNESFMQYGTVAGHAVVGSESHGYMTNRPLWHVWGAFRRAQLFSSEGR